jgi:hypothetical protein
VAGDPWASVAADAALIAEYAAVAVSDYGTAVLAADPGADLDARADSIARLGRALLLAIFGTSPPGDPLPEPLAALAADPGGGSATDPGGRSAAEPGSGPAVAALAGYVQPLLAARPDLAEQVGGMLPHCGLTLVMSRQRRAGGGADPGGAGPA